jgi:23S rRNA (cytosine1962-C5)-methyltransferase
MHQSPPKGKRVNSNDHTAIKNRLTKNKKKLNSYLSKNKIEAFRIYHKDIPEYPYLIDIYANRAVIFEQGKRLNSPDEENLRIEHQSHLSLSLEEVFGISKENQYFKIRQIQKGKDQYQTLKSHSDDYFQITEGPLKFLVNLQKYLDTGLFLDHRPLRSYLFQNSTGKKVLNLFCYTGSLSVAAALGGGLITSVDMSNTYLDWACENFKLNGIDPQKHQFLQADIMKELPGKSDSGELYDLIVLDPPSFSNSKRMEDDLDIERDHPLLIRDSLKLLAPGGTLFFSTNKKKFSLHPIISTTYKVEDISHWTIPQDFHHTEIHRAFKITKK